MIKFIKTPDPNHRYEIATVEMSLEGVVTLDQALEHFEDFLKAVGYVFDGHITVVKEVLE